MYRVLKRPDEVLQELLEGFQEKARASNAPLYEMSNLITESNKFVLEHRGADTIVRLFWLFITISCEPDAQDVICAGYASDAQRNLFLTDYIPRLQEHVKATFKRPYGEPSIKNIVKAFVDRAMLMYMEKLTTM